MAFHTLHPLHKRRMSRNIGLGVTLGALILVVFGMTYVKVREIGYIDPDKTPAAAEAKP